MSEAPSPSPSSYRSWYEQALEQQRAGQHEAAVLSFEKALEDSPNADDVWMLKGDSLLQLKKPKEACRCYKQATQINSDNIYAWLGIAKSLHGLGKLKESISTYEKALELQEREPGATRNKAVTLFHLSVLYPLDGRAQEGLLAHQKSSEIAKELNLSPDDPLASVASTEPTFFAEPFPSLAEKMDKSGAGKLIGFATKGKLQFVIVGIGFLLFFISSLLLAPIAWIIFYLKKVFKKIFNRD